MKNSKKTAIIFDMDGVLVDVSNSYRNAIILTCNKIIETNCCTLKDVESIKSIPGFNNDWDASYALIKLFQKDLNIDRLHNLQIDRGSSLYNLVYETFQTLYLGSSLYQKIYRQPSPFVYEKGLIYNERLIIGNSQLNKLTKYEYKLAIATGRPRSEASQVINSTFLKRYFSRSNLVALEDTNKTKPYPDPLLLAKKMIGANDSIYLGDTINDQLAAKAADMKFFLIGNTKKSDFSNVNLFINWYISN